MYKIIVRLTIIILLVNSFPHFLSGNEKITNDISSLVQFVVTKYDTKDGLPQSSVSAICQSEDQYLWFGTQAGMCRYNGYKFEFIKETSNLSVMDIVAYKNYLFVGTLKNLIIFRNVNGELTLLYSKNIGITDHILLQEEGLFFSANKKICFLSYSQIENNSFVHKELFELSTRVTEVKIHNNSMYTATRKGLYIFKDKGELKLVNHILKDKNISDLVIIKNKLYIGSKSYGLFVCDIDKPEEVVKISKDSIILMKKIENEIYVGTKDGIYIYNENTSEKTNKSLKNQIVISICMDINRSLWVGTSMGGLYKLRKEDAVTFTKESNGLPSDIIHSVLKIDDFIWVGTSKGIINLNTGKIISSKNGLSSDYVFSLCYYDGFLWVGSISGLDRIDLKNYSIKSYNKSQGLLRESVNSLCSYNDKLFIGTTTGINYIEKDKIYVYPGLKNQHSWYMYEDDGLYVVSNKEVIKINDKLEYETIFKEEGIIPLSVYSGYGSLFIGTLNSGIFIKKDDKEYVIKPENSNSINSIFLTSPHNLWLSTMKGIFNLHISYEEDRIKINDIKKYDHNSGLKSTDCNGGTYPNSFLDDKYFWVSSTEGLIRLNLEKRLKYDNIVRIYITDFKIGEKQIKDDKRFEIQQTNDTFGFHFNALFYEPNIKYSYYLDGIDNKWKTTTNNSTSYNNIQHGYYTFYVTAYCNNEWNGQIAIVSFEILPPFTETAWFYAMSIFLVLSTIFIIHNRIVAHLHLKRKRLERIIEMQKEQKNLQDQLIHTTKLATVGELTASLLHELGQPITSANICAYVIDKNANECVFDCPSTKSIKTLLSSIEQIKSIQNYYKEFISKGEDEFTRTKVDLNEIIDKSIELVSHSLSSKTVNIYKDKDKGTLHVNGNETLLIQVVTNIINNAKEAVLYKKDRRIDVKTFSMNGYNIISIEDNGHGIDGETLKKIGTPFFTTKEDGLGLGLSISYRIINALDGEIKVSSKIGKGTRFEILVPPYTLKQSRE